MSQQWIKTVQGPSPQTGLPEWALHWACHTWPVSYSQLDNGTDIVGFALTSGGVGFFGERLYEVESTMFSLSLIVGKDGHVLDCMLGPIFYAEGPTTVPRAIQIWP